MKATRHARLFCRWIHTSMIHGLSLFLHRPPISCVCTCTHNFNLYRSMYFVVAGIDQEGRKADQAWSDDIYSYSPTFLLRQMGRPHESCRMVNGRIIGNSTSWYTYTLTSLSQRVSPDDTYDMQHPLQSSIRVCPIGVPSTYYCVRVTAKIDKASWQANTLVWGCLDAKKNWNLATAALSFVFGN
jgi:hypothetical protein